MKLRKISLTLLTALLSISYFDVKAADDTQSATASDSNQSRSSSPKPTPIVPPTPQSPGAASEVAFVHNRSGSGPSIASRREGERASEQDEKERENQAASHTLLEILRQQTEILTTLSEQCKHNSVLLGTLTNTAQTSDLIQRELLAMLRTSNAIALNTALAGVPSERLKKRESNIYDAMQNPYYLSDLLSDEEKKTDADGGNGHATGNEPRNGEDRRGDENPKGNDADEELVPQLQLTPSKAFAYNLFYLRYSPLTWAAATTVIGRLSDRVPTPAQRPLKVSAMCGGVITFVATGKTLWDTVLPQRSFLAAHQAKQKQLGSRQNSANGKLEE